MAGGVRKWMCLVHTSRCSDKCDVPIVASCAPGWKGPRACEKIRPNPAENTWLLLASYHAISYGWYITPQTIHFRLDWKLQDHGVASNLRMFESSAPRLQCPGLRSATNLVNYRIATVLFLALDHTHCHLPARVRLMVRNCVLPLKPLNNALQPRACAILFTWAQQPESTVHVYYMWFTSLWSLALPLSSRSDNSSASYSMKRGLQTLNYS
jgi:hypothetical protein